MAERAPKASPAPRPLTTSTDRRHFDARRAVMASTPLGPCLTIASSTPRSSSAAAARRGSVSPTATSHSSRLPTATVTCGERRADLPRRSAVPEHRAVVEVEDGVGPRAPGS